MRSDAASRLTAGAVPHDGSLLSVTIPDAEGAVLARRFRCSGRGRPCAPVGLPSMNWDPSLQAKAPAGVAPEPAALPPLPRSLSVVADQRA